jgi:integrase
MAIKKLPNGRYRLYILDENGKKIRRVFEKQFDAKALEAKIEQLKYEKKLAKLKLRKERYPFDRALQDFEKTKSGLALSSQKRYGSVIKQIGYFAEAMKIKHIDEFTPDHGTLIYNELVTIKPDPKGNADNDFKPSPKTVNFFLLTLKAFFHDEVIKDHIKRSPVLHLKNLKNEKKKPDFYSIDELKKFFSQEMPLSYRQFFLGLLFSGMRFSEASNLTWEDIDFSKRLIYVRPKPGYQLKTFSSERAIPMNQDLLNLLKEIRERSSSSLVFVSPQGKVIRERRTLDICKTIAKRAGITSRAFLHKFRATYATILVRKRIPLESIKELLGHSSLSETERAYANNESSYLHKDVSALDNLLEPDP